MSRGASRILLHGPQEKLKFSSRLWVENEIDNILQRSKGDYSSVYLYSGLDQGVNLFGAKVAQKLKIPVIGCIPYEGFTSKFTPESKSLYRDVRKKLFNIKVVEKDFSQIAYRKRLLYLIHQTNTLILVWDTKEYTPEQFFYSSVRSKWTGLDRTVFHLNYESKQVRSFQL